MGGGGRGDFGWNNAEMMVVMELEKREVGGGDGSCSSGECGQIWWWE